MKTTVDLPDNLMAATRRYAEANGKTFRAVLVESLEHVLRKEAVEDSRPAWEPLYGAFKGDPAIAELEALLDREFSKVDI